MLKISGADGDVLHSTLSDDKNLRLILSKHCPFKDVRSMFYFYFRDNLLMVDSGGQYLDGTTDVTRTFHYGTPSPEQVVNRCD